MPCPRLSDGADGSAPAVFAVNEKPQIQAIKRSATVDELCEFADALDHDLATEEAPVITDLSAPHPQLAAANPELSHAAHSLVRNLAAHGDDRV